jgi:hypothetical protein
MNKFLLEQYIKQNIFLLKEVSLKKRIESLNQESTFGELKSILNSIIKSAKTKKGLEVGKSVLGFVPVVGDITGAAEFLLTLKNVADKDRPNNFLARFDLDDEVAKIVDNALEDDFIKELAKKIENISDSKKLDDFSMTDQLNGYLAKNFSNRTITGFSE